MELLEGASLSERGNGSRRSVRVSSVGGVLPGPHVAESPAQLLDHSHLFERRLDRFRGCAQGPRGGVPSLLGGVASLLGARARQFAGFPQALPLLTNSLERFAVLIADLASLLSQPAEAFGLVSGRLSRRAVFLRELPILLRWNVRRSA